VENKRREDKGLRLEGERKEKERWRFGRKRQEATKKERRR